MILILCKIAERQDVSTANYSTRKMIIEIEFTFLRLYLFFTVRGKHIAIFPMRCKILTRFILLIKFHDLYFRHLLSFNLFLLRTVIICDFKRMKQIIILYRCVYYSVSSRRIELNDE